MVYPDSLSEIAKALTPVLNGQCEGHMTSNQSIQSFSVIKKTSTYYTKSYNTKDINTVNIKNVQQHESQE